MGLNILFLIVTALLATIIIEITVAIFAGFKKKEELLTIFGINLITNPIVNYSILIIAQLTQVIFSTSILLVFEIIIVIIEAKILAIVLKKDTKEMLLLSIYMNAASFLFGLLFFWTPL